VRAPPGQWKMEPSRLFPSDLLRNVLRECAESYRLTYREEQIVDLILQGLSNKAIAAGCNITEQTVKDHLKHVYRKMGVHQRTAVIAKLLQS
jgi:DNA-binding NarL/FixJ family response regulator